MRKLSLIFASALLCAAAAQAQDALTIVPADSVTFNVAGQTPVIEEGDVVDDAFSIPSVNADVIIRLYGYKSAEVTELGYQPYIMWTKGAGFAIDQDFAAPIPLIGEPGVTAFGFSLDKEKWGNPYEGNFYAAVMLCFVQLDEEGNVADVLYGADEEPLFYGVSYSTPNDFPATLQYTYPNNDWSEESFADAYANGTVTFAFTNPVSFSNENDVASIVYTIEGELVPGATIKLSDCVLDWNQMDGFYTVVFNYSDAEFSAEEISQITITLNGTTYVPENGGNPVSVDVDPLVLVKPIANPAPRKQKSRMTDELTNGNDLVTVYNVQGMLVKESVKKSAINELPAGLYIVDGKKIVVR